MTPDSAGLNHCATPSAIEGARERVANLFASLVKNSSDIIAVLDEEGRFRFISDSLTEVLGWRPEELAGQLSFPFLHPDDLAGGLAALGRVLADPNQLVTHRYRLRHRDGHFVPIEGRATNLLADPFIQGILVNSRDITHRIQEEEVLRLTQATLEREVEIRTAEIRAANQLLQREIEERRQAEERLRSRLAETEVIAKISRVFITTDPPDFLAVLRQLGQAMGVSRSFMHLMREGLGIEASSEWSRRPEEAKIDIFQDFDMSSLGWAFQRLRRSETVFIEDVDRLPPEAAPEKELCRVLGSRAVLLVPILAKSGSLWGVIGADFTDRPHHWAPEEERLVRVASEIVVHYDTARRAEMSVRESEARFRTVFEDAAIGMILAGPGGELLTCNKVFERMLGYTESEMQGRHFREFVHPEDVSPSLPAFNGAETGSNVCQFQKRYIRKDRQPVWANTTVSLVRDSKDRVQYCIGMIEDITQERETQQQVLDYQEQLRSLASQLSLAEEQQRRRIAAELHDRIGQALAMVKIKLGACREPAILAGREEHLEDIQIMLDQIIADTRSLIFEISPPVLYELGFVPAVEWLGEQIRDRHGLPITVADDRLPKVMAEDVRVLLFQCVRELLVNVIKHARAGSARVDVRREGDWIRVAVSDDGVGFDPAVVRSRMGKQGGYGLFNIQERLASIGGSLEIENPGAQGTRIALRAPLPAARKRRRGK